MNVPLRIFIGYDDREAVAYHVLAHSLLTRASYPIAIMPLCRLHLRRELTRVKGPTESTDFAFSRFLVPYLSNYEGISIFMDCDMLCRVDIGDVLLHVLADPGKAVYVCQHDYVPKTTSKFFGQKQTAYPRKNWSSFIVYVNSKCEQLTPEYVNTASGLDLHRFHWLRDENIPEVDRIGSLPLTWNWLVGEYESNMQAKILHWTLGGPYLEETRDCDHADLWLAEHREMSKPMSLAGVQI